MGRNIEQGECRFKRGWAGGQARGAQSAGTPPLGVAEI
jgi:hypothetical protein